MSSLFHPVAGAASRGRTPAEAAAACLSESLGVMGRTGLANETDLARTRVFMERAFAEDLPADIIETLLRVQGYADDAIADEAGKIAEAMSHAMYPVLPLIPFAAKLIMPTAFYENFPQLRALAKMLMSPVLFAEDTDAAATGALNPVAAKVMAEEIVSVVDLKAGIKPFVSAVRMEHNHWAFLTRKQFSL